MLCSLCGYNFDEEKSKSGCNLCFLKKDCGLVKCPNCGIEIPKDSLIKTMPLSELPLNKEAEVVCIKTKNKSMVQKIIVMGALPKTKVVLLQKYPSYILQIQKSKFALDEAIASCIVVKFFI